MMTMYCKILMESGSAMEEMYDSLGIERSWVPASPGVRVVPQERRIPYSERLGRMLVRLGERLVLSAQPRNLELQG